MVSNNQRITLVCAGDDNFSIPLAVSLFSALKNLTPCSEVQVYILDCGISPQNKNNIERVLGSTGQRLLLEWVSSDMSRYECFVNTKWLNATAYGRLTIADRLPRQITKVIYLDSDLIVYGDLRELWQLPLDGYALLAARDYKIPYVSSPSGLVDTYRLLGLKPDTPYLNSGLMVIDLERWRKEKTSDKIFSYLEQYKDTLRYADQDGLNAVLCNDWIELDPKWNVQAHAARYCQEWPASEFKEKMLPQMPDLMRHPNVLHFTGTKKPWNSGLRSSTTHHFHNHLKSSKWFNPLGYILWRLKWLMISIKLICENTSYWVRMTDE